jgi:hypothetical protein
MTGPTITVIDARAASQNASPAVMFRLRITFQGQRVHALVLRCQVQIDARGRRYAPDEQERLYDLFGSPAQFVRTVRPLSWAQCSTIVPPFTDDIECDLAVGCTYDLEAAASKFLHAIRDGVVPLLFVFSGTAFRVNGSGGFSVEPIPWDVEASYRLPVRVWRATMDQFFPGGGWLRLRKDTIDRLQSFKGRSALRSWDETIDALLERVPADQPA